LIRTSVGVRDFKFRTGSCCSDPAVVERVRQGQYPAPPGFDQPYTVLLGRAELAVDSRPPRPHSQTGARLALNVEEDVGTTNAPHSWIRYGGTVGGFWDVTGTARVLSLSVITTFVDPTGGNSNNIPFPELATLGGAEPFVGFLAGRLYDRSAFAIQLRYEWPIWAWLDGELHVATGNVFGPHLDGFRAGLMRLSTGIGFRSIRSSALPGFELLVGLGTETFDSGTRVSSFRFAFGSTYGF
jgi:outer membrane protein assembly factor BamA